MNERIVLLIFGALLFSGCSSSTGKMAAEAKPGDGESAGAAKNLKDEPLVVADGSFHLLFRSPAHDSRPLAPIYGCCLATPGVKGKKELRIYQPAAEGSEAVKLTKNIALTDQDVVQVFFDRKGDAGWTPFDKDRLPSPQLIFYRRDLSRVAAIDDAQYADFATAGKNAWIINSEITPTAADEISGLAKGLSMKSEFQVGGRLLRLGRVVVKRPDNSAETITLGNGCSALEFCSAPNCLAGMNSPCAAGASQKTDDKKE